MRCVTLGAFAMEALHRQQTVTRRWPSLVAFLFGLVHGLGFAGALAEIGLPERHTNIALLTFNLGVEARDAFSLNADGVLRRPADCAATGQVPLLGRSFGQRDNDLGGGAPG